MGSDPKITYEVHVLQQGRWELQATYAQDKQGAAIRDAKALENISTITGVKVIREELNTKNGKTKENNVYASSNLKDEQPKAAQEARKAKARVNPVNPTKAAKPAKAAEGPSEVEVFLDEGENKQAFSILGFLVKILMVMLFSAIISMLVTGVATVWLQESAFAKNTQSNIIFGMFIGTFAICVGSMGWSMLSKGTLKIPAPQAAPPKSATARKRTLTPSLEDFKPNVGFDDDAKDEVGANVGKENPDEESQDADFDEAAPQSSEADATSDIQATPVVAPMEESPKVIIQKEFVLEFMANAMDRANASRLSMDNFNKFGVSLFMAGACETLSQERNLDGQTLAKIISEPVKQLGFKGGDTESFSDKIQGYLLADSRYMQMFQAGRAAMTSHLDNDPEGMGQMEKALAEWNSPKKKEAESKGPVTVLFTDIAGSTNMTQTLGDAVAQQVVRAHNKIVRSALSNCQGKEIKHTGDGIMASFSVTSNGVEAAAEMQKGCAKHNEANPDLPLGLKIGLDAGEPIAEDNDLFGSTVQLAARIVDKAQAGQIYISETVQGMCSGKNYRFSRVGSFDMKGFDEGVRLYELIWDDNAPMPKQMPEQKPEKPPEPKPEPKPEVVAEAEPQTAPETPTAEPVSDVEEDSPQAT